MLISFAVTNHRSLRERSELSLVAESRPTVADRAVLDVPGFDLQVVPVVALVGANGSGKSNLLDALAYATAAVVRSQTRWRATSPPPRVPFVSKEGPDDAPSVYELTFAVEGVVYEYEFHVGSSRIEYEQLLMSPNGSRSRTRLFERKAGRDDKAELAFGRRLTGPRAAAEAATRSNSLFLSSAAQNNQPVLTPVWAWIAGACRTASPYDRDERADYTAARYLEGNERYRARVRDFLAGADLGIADVTVRAVEWSKEELLSQGLQRVPPDEADAGSSAIGMRVSLHHRGDVGTLDLSEESAGTVAWFEWAAPIIDTLDRGGVLAADELDAHLNVHLATHSIGAFQDERTNRGGAQLIFTTQETNALDLIPLGRDQIWVTEKSERGATSLLPLTDFGARREWDLGRAYRHGRFGGLPVVDEARLGAALSGAGR